jgi:hypothetical protein
VQVDEYNVTRLRLTAEMADSSNLVKSLVIKAEDARILFDMCAPHRLRTAPLAHRAKLCTNRHMRGLEWPNVFRG